jgi:hypothetical protein
MAILKRADVAPSPALREEVVEVPELGGSVIVRGMTVSEQLFVGGADDRIEMTETVAFVVSRCVLDAEHEPLMSLEHWERFPNLGVMIRLVNKAKALSAATADEKKADGGTSSSESPTTSDAPSESSPSA